MNEQQREYNRQLYLWLQARLDKCLDMDQDNYNQLQTLKKELQNDC